jgi:galactose-inhibitable lectin light subunit
MMMMFISVNSASPKYNVKYPAEADVFYTSNELFKRDKCKTCCKVMFVSEWSPNDHTKYTMDMEFARLDQVREAKSDWEQTILIKPIDMNRKLQQFELYSYKMINPYYLPKRVHDIRSGISIGNKLIIWKKKAPLAEGTNNQRFVYHHPYRSHYYQSSKNGLGDYPKHFQAPYYTKDNVCYEVETANYQRWTGNNLQNRPTHSEVYEGAVYDYNTNEYQIKINKCDNDNVKQRWELVYV